jgi:hypothetical protein
MWRQVRAGVQLTPAPSMSAMPVATAPATGLLPISQAPDTLRATQPGPPSKSKLTLLVATALTVGAIAAAAAWLLLR